MYPLKSNRKTTCLNAFGINWITWQNQRLNSGNKLKLIWLPFVGYALKVGHLKEFPTFSALHLTASFLMSNWKQQKATESISRLIKYLSMKSIKTVLLFSWSRPSRIATPKNSASCSLAVVNRPCSLNIRSKTLSPWRLFNRQLIGLSLRLSCRRTYTCTAPNRPENNHHV